MATNWCVDSTHKTCKSLDGKNDSYLFTTVVTSPVTRQGVPVCFFVTDAEKTTALAQWLDWVKQSVPGLNVERIMIDCSATEIAAIKVHLVMMYKFYYATGISKELRKLT
jgi:hypothetical protein